jgi:hypothetical protein
VAGDGADRAERQAVVAPHQQRHVALRQRLVDGVVDRPVPRHHLGQVAHAVGGRLPGIGRPGEVAAVDHVELAGAQRLQQAGDPQRIRAHAGAAHAGPDVGRRADQSFFCAAR